MKSLLNNKNVLTASLLFCSLLMAFNTAAKISLAPQFTSNMVLQRDTINTLQGHADSAEHISIWMDGHKLKDINVKPGLWLSTLPVTSAGGPHKLSVQTQSQIIELNNVLFGDLWLASGQSNMEYTLGMPGSLYQQEIDNASSPQIRQFRVERNAAYQQPLDEVAKGQWLIAQGQDLTDFSAVAYFFAKQIQAQTGIPIGIINNAHAGARIQAWLSEQALADYPAEMQLIQRNKSPDLIKELQLADQQNQQQWQQQLAANDPGLMNKWFAQQLDDSQWQQLSVPGYWADQGQEAFSGSMWFRRSFDVSAEQAKEAAVLELGRIIDQDEVYVNGKLVGSTAYQYPQRRYSLATGLLKAGVNQISVRLTSFSADKAGFVPAKPYQLVFADSQTQLGGLWRYKVGYRMLTQLANPRFKTNEQPAVFYNAMLAPLAQTQLKGIIWYQGESNADEAEDYKRLFPAMINEWRELFAQPQLPFLYVQLPNYLSAQSDPGITGWADIRDAQTSGLTLSNTAMVAAIDLGEWNDIHPRNKASIGKRLANAALQKVYDKQDVVYQGPELTCAERVSDKLIKVHSEFYPLAINGQDNRVQGFAISQDNIHYDWVEGELNADHVLLQVTDANQINYVSYAWQSNPVRANLINNHKLPAYPAKLAVTQRCENRH